MYRSNVLDYIHAYMRHWKLYEEKREDLLNDEGDGDDNNGHNNKNKRQKGNNVVFRYDWLIGDDYDNNEGGVHVHDPYHGARKGTPAIAERDVQTLQDRIIQYACYRRALW